MMKSRPLQDVVVDSIYKSKDTDSRVAAQRKEDAFPDVSDALDIFQYLFLQMINNDEPN